ncbi:MAG: 3-methyl-2-oxobutanoate hydroxymethyltransferase [Chloroflexi bacterium]|nr:3-methyl-2-oxobutanoate hydroxymethyltransferase [Chloroflexota bacterium]
MDKVTLQQLQAMKERGEPISMLTAYDYPSGLLADQSGVDMILVGDSLGMVVHGFESTLPVTMDMMVLHTQAVRRGVKRAFLVGDMPFMSYQASREEALRNAGRLLKEGNADAIKLEGGLHMAETVHAMVQVGIAVMGHIGLTPQSVSAFGGFKVQGKSIEAARKLIEDAKAIEAAGAFSIVIEGVPAKLAELITRMVSIPTIGIGAGGGTDGQVLVMHDILGMFDRFTPKFVKQYAKIGEAIQNVFTTFHQEVRSGAFPAPEHEFGISDAVLNEILAEIGDAAH